MPSKQSARLMGADDIDRAITRIAHEILEKNKSLDGLALVGIRTRGVPLAQRLCERLRELTDRTPPTGLLDINLYRDDLSLIAAHPVLKKTEIPFDVDGSKIVLVDDVLFTGRTIRAALDSLMDLGRPDWIQLAVLVDRGHREVPIRADYVGKNVPTSRDESVEVLLELIDGREEVLLIKDAEPGKPAETQESSR
jgi:pyrimidine operon attenuation protein/uracil phosphoribosyltransferase